MENSSKENKTADLAKYQREYMHKRYHEDVEKSRLYKNSLKAKKLYNMSAEDLKVYGEYSLKFYQECFDHRRQDRYPKIYLFEYGE